MHGCTFVRVAYFALRRRLHTDRVRRRRRRRIVVAAARVRAGGRGDRTARGSPRVGRDLDRGAQRDVGDRESARAALRVGRHEIGRRVVSRGAAIRGLHDDVRAGAQRQPRHGSVRRLALRRGRRNRARALERLDDGIDRRRAAEHRQGHVRRRRRARDGVACEYDRHGGHAGHDRGERERARCSRLHDRRTRSVRGADRAHQRRRVGNDRAVGHGGGGAQRAGDAHVQRRPFDHRGALSAPTRAPASSCKLRRCSSRPRPRRRPQRPAQHQPQRRAQRRRRRPPVPRPRTCRRSRTTA